MDDQSPETRIRAAVVRLHDVKMRVGTEALLRYTELKTKGRVDEEARNVAVAWTCARYPHFSKDVVRRELDDAIKPKPQGRALLTPDHWRLPE